MPAIVKSKKISADEARAKAKDRFIERDGGGDLMQRASRAPVSWDPDKRSARFRMTTEEKDRYGDIVRTEGLDTTQFLKNPVGLMFHNSRTWPIGNWANLEKVLTGRPKRLEGDLIVLPAGGPVVEIDQAAWMLENGGIRANSIGFIPDWNEVEILIDDDGNFQGLDFIKSELVECSICPIPANPGALMKHAAGDMKMARELLEYTLDTYARTPEGLLVPRSEFEKAYKVTVEKIQQETAPKLPVTDDEKVAADLRAVAFEVAQLCPAIAGATAAAEGDGVNARFQAVDGKWRHAGVNKDGDEANYVVLVEVKDEKRVYTLISEMADDGAPAAGKREGNAWTKAKKEEKPETDPAAPRQLANDSDVEAFMATLKKGDVITIEGSVGKPVLKVARPGGSTETVVCRDLTTIQRVHEHAEKLAAEPANAGKIALTIDTTEAVTQLNSLLGLADTVSKKLSSIFGKKNETPERVEPTIDVPKAQPSAEEISAARAKATATTKRLQESLA